MYNFFIFLEDLDFCHFFNMACIKALKVYIPVS